MYNERIVQNDGTRRRDMAYNGSRAMRSHQTRLSDIPTAALPQTSNQGSAQGYSRRGCDGTLKDENNSTRQGWGLIDHPLAMVYSPYQIWRDAYSPDVALKRGTLFAELDLPFEAAGSCKGGC